MKFIFYPAPAIFWTLDIGPFTRSANFADGGETAPRAAVGSSCWWAIFFFQVLLMKNNPQIHVIKELELRSLHFFILFLEPP